MSQDQDQDQDWHDQQYAPEYYNEDYYVEPDQFQAPLVQVVPPIPNTPAPPLPTQLPKASTTPPIQLTYHTCPKPGYHSGQRLTLVCLQPACHQDQLLCAICFEENHNGHKVKPLKSIANKARYSLKLYENLSRCQSTILTTIQQSSVVSQTNLAKFDSNSTQMFQQVREAIIDTHSKIRQQFNLRENDEKTLDRIELLGKERMEAGEFVEFVKGLREGVPLDWREEDDVDVESSHVEDSVIGIKKNLYNSLDSILKLCKQNIPDIQPAKFPSLFQSVPNYEFSPTLKHPLIKIIDKTKVIKHDENINYHLALVQPSLDFSKPHQKYGFKLTSGAHTWSALGIVNKAKAKECGYVFSPSKVSHGLEMISSNTGTWSNTTAYNSTVKSFIFKQGDTVVMEYESSPGQLVFSGGGGEYKLPFVVKAGEEWCLGVVLYNAEDEIEILGEVK